VLLEKICSYISSDGKELNHVDKDKVQLMARTVRCLVKRYYHIVFNIDQTKTQHHIQSKSAISLPQYPFVQMIFVVSIQGCVIYSYTWTISTNMFRSLYSERSKGYQHTKFENETIKEFMHCLPRQSAAFDRADSMKFSSAICSELKDARGAIKSAMYFFRTKLVSYSNTKTTYSMSSLRSECVGSSSY
jgi:hypothetical protein